MPKSWKGQETHIYHSIRGIGQNLVHAVVVDISVLQESGPKKTMTATDVTGFDAIFSTGFFATFSRF